MISTVEPPFHGAGSCFVAIVPRPVGFQASQGREPGIGDAVGAGESVGTAADDGSVGTTAASPAAGSGVSDADGSGGTEPAAWSFGTSPATGGAPSSMCESGEKLTRSPKTGTVTASITATRTRASGRPDRRQSKRRSRRATPATAAAAATAPASAGRSADPSEAPAQLDTTPIASRVNRVSSQPPGSNAPAVPVAATAACVSAVKVGPNTTAAATRPARVARPGRPLPIVATPAAIAASKRAVISWARSGSKPITTRVEFACPIEPETAARINTVAAIHAHTTSPVISGLARRARSVAVNLPTA